MADRAVEAFLRGTWTVEATMPGGGPAVRGRATVELSFWSIDWGAGAEVWKGSHRLHGGGQLAIEITEGPKALTREQGTQAHMVPMTVGDRFELTLPWQPPGARRAADDQVLTVAYDGKTLTIRHVERGGSVSTYVCNRA
ncbi:hypothetical protein [Streptomyces bambusae]|uniref:Lipocalin-like domain-containing protein n=1 Tax=Streptomyces bambusae TaxID=1550616 RepID=A0ABS6ZDG4_9ACTN|nr:hypothetical protein [Streptomyces bambusae]MBW5485803.1 hypothetical protein [Streptomyces bambusae]